MAKTIAIGFLIVLLLLGVASTAAFAILYINSQNDVKNKNDQLALCQAGNTTTTNTTGTCPTTETSSSTTTFTDNGADVKVTYPNSWTGALTTNISSDFAYDPVYGRVITKYEFNLTKSGANLKFQKLIGGVDGFPAGFKNSEIDWKLVDGTNLIRFSTKGENSWKYVQKIDCSTLGEPIYTPEQVASFDVCVGSFFPGFGTVGANVVTIQTADPALLSEADQIAKSALN